MNTQISTPSKGADPFYELGLSNELCDAVADAGYRTPTPIQAAAIPLVLDGIDVLGCAQTGSGKTAAFALPILQQLLEEPAAKPTVRALVLAPTRELAAQIGDCFGTYQAGTGLRHLVVFGGVNKNPQVRALRRPPEVLVACPGRLLDLMSTGDVDLSDVEYVVLDEADRMLDMGFIHDVRKILKALPEERQTLLFSATMPKEIEKLAARFLYRPERIAVDPVASTAPPIKQSVFFVDAKKKSALLGKLLQDADVDRALVFTRTKHGANRVAQRLEKLGIGAAPIHGNKSQGARERALSGFKDGSIRVVVATDIASRGIDVKSLSHVINFDLPNIPETYVHRVGRTGRAGETGTAWSLCSDEERPYLRDIEKLTGKRLERADAGEDFAAAEDFDHESRAGARPSHGRGRSGGSRSGPRRSGGSGSSAQRRSRPNTGAARRPSGGDASGSGTSGSGANRRRGRRPKPS